MKRIHSTLVVLLGILAALAVWKIVQADDLLPVPTNPVQAQVQAILPSLIASEAERAMGAYYPGIGVFLTLDLLRGPNTQPNKLAHIGTRDWAIYLMQTFGSNLKAVPTRETIALSINYYDFTTLSYHQLVINCLAESVSDPSKYNYWLDGKPFDEVARQLGGSSAGDNSNLLPAQGETPVGSPAPASATVSLPPTPGPSPVPTSPPNPATETLSNPFKLSLDFSDTSSSARDWTPLGGTWTFLNGAYTQIELNRFDLISFYKKRLTGNFRFSAQIKYIKGEMGGGLIFNAPSNLTKASAQMISYTAGGTYFQWGYFDKGGIFQYQGGTPVSTGGDGNFHKLEVLVTGSEYEVLLDGISLEKNISLVNGPGGFSGLFGSTSELVFDNVNLESL